MLRYSNCLFKYLNRYLISITSKEIAHRISNQKFRIQYQYENFRTVILFAGRGLLELFPQTKKPFKRHKCFSKKNKCWRELVYKAIGKFIPRRFTKKRILWTKYCSFLNFSSRIYQRALLKRVYNEICLYMFTWS